MDTKGVFKKVVNLVTLSSFLLWNLAAATPEGGQVVAGSAQISQSQNQTVINQSSQSAVINWNGFNTAANESVQFNQPNSSAIALNKINSGLPTNFNGSLNANGQVWIINPAGVLFGSTANVNVAGLLASTHNINNSDFMAGSYNFAAPTNLSASIINNGNITVADSGIVALVAPYVVNNGIIQANLGKVYLSTGGAFVLDLYGDSLINFGSNSSISNGSVENNGLIEATGGKVFMTANAAAGLLDNVISMAGTIKATTATTGKHGEIILNGGHTGKVKVSGTLDASNGGFIETSGEYVDSTGAYVNVGVGGTWSIDPTDLTIDAPTAAGYAATLSGGGNVSVSATNNIFFQANLTAGGTGSLTLTATSIIFNSSASTAWNSTTGGSQTFNGTSYVTGVNAIAPTETISATGAGSDITFNGQLGKTGVLQGAQFILNAGHDINFTQNVLLGYNTGTGDGGAYISSTAGDKIFLGTLGNPALFLFKGGLEGVFDPFLTAESFYFHSPVVLNQNVQAEASVGYFGSTINSNGNGLYSFESIGAPGGLGGSTTFMGNIGGGANGILASFRVDSSTTYLNFDNVSLVRTYGSQIYDDLLVFMTNSAVNKQFIAKDASNNLQTISFSTNNLRAGFQGLPINSVIYIRNDPGTLLLDGNAIFNGDVVGTGLTQMNALTVTGTTTFNGFNNGGATITAASQDYKGAVTVNGPTTTLNSIGLIKFGSTINGAVSGVNSLTINPSYFPFSASGNVEFDGSVGATTPLYQITMNSFAGGNGIESTLTVNPLQTANFLVKTANAQQYGLQVLLAGDATFISTGDGLSFLNNTNGPYNLTLTAFNPVTLGPKFDQSNYLNSLTITNNTIFNWIGIQTVAGQTYGGAVTLNTGALLVAGGNIIFQSTLDGISNGGQVLGLNAGGTVQFQGNVGSSKALNSLGVTASQININTNSITTSGTQQYNNPVTINNIGLVTLTGSTIQFSSSVNSTGTPAQIQIDGNFVMANSASIGQSSNVGQLIVLNGNSASIRGNITTTGDTTFTGPVTLTADTSITDTGTGIFFNSTVDSDNLGPWSLTLNATVGPVEFDDNVGATNPLNVLDVTAGNGIIINPNISSNPVLSIITNSDQNYNGNIQLTTTYTSPGTVPSDILQSNSGNITLNGPVSLIYPGGEVSLFLDAANNVYINNTISMNPAPGSPGEGGYLDVTAGNAIYINTSTIEVGSAGDSNTPVPILRSLDFHSPVLLQQDLTITSSSWGHVMIHSTIDTDPLALSEHSLTMIAPTLVDIYGSMGVIRPLSVIDIQSAVLRFLNGGSIQYITTGNQTYSQTQFDSLFTAIGLAATDVTFTSTGNGLISILGGIHSFFFNSSMQINGNAYLQGNNFSSPNFYTDGIFFSIVVTGDTEFDNAIIQTKLSNQFYQGNVTVTDNGASLSTIAAVIEFGGNVNSVTGNNSAALSLSTPFDGYTQFDGIVNVGAGTDPLASLTMSDPIRFNGSTFNIDNFTFASAIGITSLGGVVNPSTLVTFNNTIDGISVGNAGNLIVNGNAAINGTIGGSQPLFRLYVSGTTQLGADVSTYGDTEFGGAVILTSNSIITDTGTGIFFDSTIDSDAFGPWSLTTDATAGPVEYDSDIGLSQPLNVLDTTAATGIYFNDKPAQQDVMVINTVGSQIYNGDIVLRPLSTINPTTVTLTASNAGADITFNGKITVPYVAGMYIRLYVNAANNVNINDDVLLAPTPCLGNFFCGGYLDVTAGNVINIDAANLEGGSAPVGFTLHSFAFNSPIILFQSVVNVLGVGVADFNSSINSDSSVVGGTALSFDTYDVTTFGGQMGTAVNSALASLSIAANPVTSLRFTAGANAITTIGNQDLHPPVFYFGNAGMTFTSQSGVVHFYAENTAYYPTGRTAIDTNYTSGYVHVNGDVIFDGDIIPLISANPFNEFSLAGPVIVTGTTEINNGSTIDAQSQDYQQAVTVDGGTVMLNSTGLITFGSTVDSVNASPTSLNINGVGFTFLSPGSVQMNGAVGSVMPLNNLDVTASILFGAFIYLNTPSITTTSDQLYHGNVALQTNVDAPGMVAGGNIIFDSRIDNGFNLTANATGIIQFNGVVGSTPLNILDMTASQIQINTSGINTINDQLYHSPVLLQANVNSPGMTAGGNIIFDSTIDGGFNLTANATGIIQFNDVVGSTPLNILDMTASQININTVWINTLSDQNYNGPVVLMTNVDFSGLGMRSISGVMTYNSTLNGDGNGPWNVAITGTEVRFKGNIGTVNPLNALNVNADVINFDGGVTTITTLGTQTYTGATLMSMNADPVFTAPSFVINIPVLINANTTYNSTAGDIDFQSTVDGDGISSLILNPVGGSAIFRADVGFGTALGSLSVNGTSSISGATIIQTNGNQIYSDTVTLNNSVTMNTLVNGNIQYNGGGVVDAGANTLTASSANTAQGPVGHGITGKVNVTNLTLSGPGGANLSEDYPVSESFVGGQGGQQARTNTIAPPNVEGVVIYCVNGFNCTPAPTPTNNIPNNIPQLQVFNLLIGLQVCDSSGCSNLAVVFDDVAEAGTVNCVVGFAQIMDQSGQKRIAFPGVSIYAGESIVADAGSQVCIKNLDGKMKCKTAPR